MTWADHYLKLPSEAAWLKAIPATWKVPNESGHLVLSLFSGTHAVDVVGILYRDDTPEGQPPVAREGFHVNLRLPDDRTVPVSMLPFVIPAPVKPSRVFV
jgi:hypothetical protein